MFFAGRVRYRKAGVLFGALAALTFGFAPLVVFAPTLRRSEWTGGIAAGVGIIGLVCGLFIFMGCKLLWRWLAGGTLLLEISDEGVRYGRRYFAWEQIRWIGGSSERGRVQLAMKCQGVPRELPLFVDEPLTVDRYDALMQELSAALRERYPHVAVG
jgi:hypothetical protein